MKLVYLNRFHVQVNRTINDDFTREGAQLKNNGITSIMHKPSGSLKRHRKQDIQLKKKQNKKPTKNVCM